MKILYVLDCSLDNGGAPKSTLILANEMCSLGFKVGLLIPESEYKRDSVSQITIFTIRTKNQYIPYIYSNPFKFIISAWKLFKIMKNFKPDLIHTQMPNSAHLMGFLKRILFYKKFPLMIYTDREHIPEMRKIKQVINHILIAKTHNKIVTLSNDSRRHWEKYNNKVSLIFNTAGKIFEKYDQQNHILYRKKYDIDVNEKVVIFVGRFTEIKNWPQVIEFIKEISVALDILFIFAISINNKSEENSYQIFRVQVAEVYSKTIFYKNVDLSILNELYYVSDIHVITSLMESFGRTAVEAMSRKCIVVSKAVGGLKDIIPDNRFFANSTEEYVEIIKAIFQLNPDDINNYKKLFLQTYQEKFSLKSNIDKHIELYHMSDIKK